jgi:hypothetical protein
VKSRGITAGPSQPRRSLLGSSEPVPDFGCPRSPPCSRSSESGPCRDPFLVGSSRWDARGCGGPIPVAAYDRCRPEFAARVEARPNGPGKPPTRFPCVPRSGHLRGRVEVDGRCPDLRSHARSTPNHPTLLRKPRLSKMPRSPRSCSIKVLAWRRKLRQAIPTRDQAAKRPLALSPQTRERICGSRNECFHVGGGHGADRCSAVWLVRAPT